MRPTVSTERHTMHCEWPEDRAEQLARVRERVRQKLAAAAERERRATTLSATSTYRPPRYDAVYFEGVAWLSRL